MGERIESPVEKYVLAATAHGSATEIGDDERANREFDALIDAYRQMDQANLQSALVPLLQHDVASVRAWAATHLLDLRTDDAIRVLSDLAQESSIVGFSAEMTLREWTQGTLKIPK